MGPLQIVLIVLGAILLAGIAFAAGVIYRKTVSEREIGSAEEDSLQINAMRRKIPNSGMLPDKNETLADVPAQRTPYRIYFTGMSGECQVEL